MKKVTAISSLAIIGLVICAIIFCGRSPSDVPLPPKGAIRVSARVDTALVDSMFVKLDNVDQGWLPNGCLLSDIIAGRHLITAAKPDPQSPIDFSSIPKLVTVRAGETTHAALALTKLAPNFTLKNLQQQEITLANYQGKVVLLVFFSHT